MSSHVMVPNNALPYRQSVDTHASEIGEGTNGNDKHFLVQKKFKGRKPILTAEKHFLNRANSQLHAPSLPELNSKIDGESAYEMVESNELRGERALSVMTIEPKERKSLVSNINIADIIQVRNGSIQPIATN